MVTAGNHEFDLGQLRRDQLEGHNHELKPLIGSPLPECQNAVSGSTPPREVREFGPARKDAVRTQMHIIPPVLVVEDLAIAGHQHGDRVRKQQHSRRECARETIYAFVANPGIF